MRPTLLCLAVAMGTIAHLARADLDLPSLAEKVRPSVVLVMVIDANGNEIATGTGFSVSKDGLLVTNYHVIEGGFRFSVKAEGGKVIPVDGIAAADPAHDLTILKLNTNDLLPIPLGDSHALKVGSKVALIGSPLGLEGTLSDGILSASFLIILECCKSQPLSRTVQAVRR